MILFICIVVALYGLYEIVIGLWMMFVGLMIIIFGIIPKPAPKPDKMIVWKG